MMPHTLIICAALLTTTILGVTGQENEYVVLFLENEVAEIDVQQSVELYIASRASQAVTVSIDNPSGSVLSGNNAIASFTLNPDEVRMFDVPNSARQITELGYKAIRVRAVGGDVIVYALNRNLYSTDGLTVFNSEQVGSEYYALAYTPSEFSTQIGLIALEDGVTSVGVTVPLNTVVEWQGTQYNAGETITITLNTKYRTAVLSSLIQSDLTGARIVSNRKFAAFSGDVRTTVYDGTSRDHLCEQLPPVEQWGFTYYTVRTPSRTADRPDVVRIIAHEDNTQIEIRGNLNEQFTMSSGEFRELIAYGPLYINSGDKSVMVGVFSTSQSTANKATDIGDPSMIIMPAEGQYSADYTFSTPTYRKPEGSDTDEYTIYVLAIVKSTEVSGLRLNGQTVNVAWTEIAGTEYSHSEIPVSNNRTYNLMHTDSQARFLALLYGSADRESFYFPIDVGNININVVVPIEIVGNKGEKGDIGAQGSAGAQGATGITGVKGAKGARGDRGDKGAKGSKGDAGNPSSIGATGAIGATGNTGATGPAGVAGAVGPIGSIGATGSTGATGARGTQGVKGAPGAPGDLGEVGPTGYQGFAGEKGEKGEPGEQGIKGVVGPAGVPGDSGYVVTGSCDDTCSVKDSTTAEATCRLTYGTVTHLCSCPPGFHLTEANPDECVDINECDLEFCSHSCENLVGGYTCSCPSGYTLAGGRNCIDVDECLDSARCPSDEVCVNSIGGFVCLSTSTSSQAQTANLEGLQTLYRKEFFIAVLCLLILMTILLMASSICLLVRHRTRSGLEKRRNQLYMEQTRVVYPSSGVTQDGYY